MRSDRAALSASSSRRFGAAGLTTAVVVLAEILATGNPVAAARSIRPSQRPRPVQLAQTTAPLGGRIHGDPVAGKAAFERQCAICHTVEQGGENRYGPNLFAINGRRAGTAPGYTYTRAFKTAATWVWEDGLLAGWIAAPGRMARGTAMAVFPGVADRDRNNIVAYLDTLTPRH